MRTYAALASSVILVLSTAAPRAADGDERIQEASSNKKPVLAIVESQGATSGGTDATRLSGLTDAELKAKLTALQAELARRKKKTAAHIEASNNDPSSPSKQSAKSGKSKDSSPSAYYQQIYLRELCSRSACRRPPCRSRSASSARRTPPVAGTASRAGGRSDGRGNRPRRRRAPRPRRRARSIAAAHRTPSASATAAIASNGRRRGSRCVSWRCMWCVFFGNRVGRGPDEAKQNPGELAVRVQTIFNPCRGDCPRGPLARQRRASSRNCGANVRSLGVAGWVGRIRTVKWSIRFALQFGQGSVFRNWPI
jgi:hypothetical protein